MFLLLKSTHAFKQEFSSGLKSTDLTFKLIHINFNYGAYNLHLDLEQLKDRTISQALCLKFFVQLLFQSFFASFQK